MRLLYVVTGSCAYSFASDVDDTWMSRWKLGSKVRISGIFHPKEYTIYK